MAAKFWTKDKDQFLIENYSNQELSSEYFEKHIGSNWRGIQQRAHKIGLKRMKYLLLDENEVIRKYNELKSAIKVSKYFKCSTPSIHAILEKHNIKKIGTNRVYEFNEEYFETIDTEEKAYWLGFIYADGCICKSIKEYDTKVFYFILKRSDRSSLEKFCNSIEISTDIIKNRSIVKNNKKYPNSRITIHRQEFINHLMDKGVCFRKTFKTEFPYNKISEGLYHHFIRGYFDGDGCITFSNKNTSSPSVSIIGTENFLRDIEKQFIKHIEFKKKEKLSIPKSSPNIRYLQYGGRYKAIKIKDYLYKNANIFMERKKERFDLVEDYSDGHKSSETANLLGIGQSTLDEWELHGYIKAERTPWNDRIFSKNEIKRVKEFLDNHSKISEAAKELNLNVRYIRTLEEKKIIKLFRGDSSYILIHKDEIEKIRKLEENKNKEIEKENEISFSVKDAAKEIGISDSTMKKMVRGKMVKTFSGLDGFNRIMVEEIDRIKKEREVVGYSSYLMDVSREVGCHYSTLNHYEQSGHIKIVRLPFDRERILNEDIPKIKKIYEEGKIKANSQNS